MNDYEKRPYHLINVQELVLGKYYWTGLYYGGSEIWKNDKNMLLLDKIKDNCKVYNVWDKFPLK